MTYREQCKLRADAETELMKKGHPKDRQEFINSVISKETGAHPLVTVLTTREDKKIYITNGLVRAIWPPTATYRTPGGTIMAKAQTTKEFDAAVCAAYGLPVIGYNQAIQVETYRSFADRYSETLVETARAIEELDYVCVLYSKYRIAYDSHSLSMAAQMKPWKQTEYPPTMAPTEILLRIAARLQRQDFKSFFIASGMSRRLRAALPESMSISVSTVINKPVLIVAVRAPGTSVAFRFRRSCLIREGDEMVFQDATAATDSVVRLAVKYDPLLELYFNKLL